jgi:biopolymer transport protein ExbD
MMEANNEAPNHRYVNSAENPKGHDDHRRRSMNSIAINTLIDRKRRSWSVTLLILATVMSAAAMCPAQVLQKGISVELAPTRNALPMPDADNEDSVIVTVTDNGGVYLGVDPIALDALGEKIKGPLSDPKQQFYIKADARSPYAEVLKVLQVAHGRGAEWPILLTGQHESLAQKGWNPPEGLQVRVGIPPTSGLAPTVIAVLDTGRRFPALEIDDARTPWATLQSTLAQFLRNLDKRIVLIKADGALPFAQVVHVIDVCRAAGSDDVWVAQEP